MSVCIVLRAALRCARLARAESERVKDPAQIREQTAAAVQELVKAAERDFRRIVAAPAAEEDVIEIPGPQDNGLDIPVPLPAPAPNDPAGERS